ncbi:MBL fold metallo-hydrolase [Rothia halotolerans]|uniref:MBL fold metallo-hydrolase n=1 Tax=Rothia halotolerans TaxID=405770 RepID=UPI00101BC9BA|nr:MBL fold metallo-hydrolase [Rothia halotolerans]
MRLTKHGHSCIRLEKDGEVLVLDPGNFSDAEAALAGADHLLITHEHPDHWDREPVRTFLAEHPEVRVCAPGSVAAALREEVPAPERVHTAEGGQRLRAGSFDVLTVGGQHALIHPQVPVVQNLGYVVDGGLYHPGDCLIVPEGVRVQTLLLPIHAPWNKVQEVIDFLIAVRAERALPIHDALLAQNGRDVIEKHLTSFGSRYGTEYRTLAAGDAVEL